MRARPHPERPHRATPVPASIVALAACLSALAIVALPATARAQTVVPTQAPGCIAVEVRNVRADRGMLMVAAYDDAAAFRKSPAVATQMRAASATVSFPLCGLTGSAVALTLYQDLNGNGKLDSNAFGMPTEPWGASGRPVAMTAPTWDSAAVPVDGATVVVTLSQ